MKYLIEVKEVSEPNAIYPKWRVMLSTISRLVEYEGNGLLNQIYDVAKTIIDEEI